MSSLPEEDVHPIIDVPVHRCSSSALTTSGSDGTGRETRKEARERERIARLHGKLTDLSFMDISCTRNGHPDFLKAKVLVCVRGSRSQFDPRVGKAKTLLPPLTGDCCQTFATLSAVLLGSLGFAVSISECCTTSTVNYLLYIAAWLHQLTSTSWPSRGSRPTVRDLNTCLHLTEFFPAKVCDEEFDVVFYNQAPKALDLLRQMCTPSQKRGRNCDGPTSSVCGYVVVSGDYTVSIFSVDHDIKKGQPTRYAQAWSFYICDSHATQPWSLGKASVTGLTFGVPSQQKPQSAPVSQGGSLAPARQSSAVGADTVGLPVIGVDDGIHYFSTILFTLLEEHRRGVAVAPGQIPYMTWTPIRRKRALAYVAEELKEVIDRKWLPKVLQNQCVKSEASKFDFHPLECFLGVRTAAAEKNDT